MRRFGLYLMALVYFVAGLLHMIKPGYYMQIMPDWIPFNLHLPLVYFSGVAEAVLAVGLLIPRVRRLAAWGVIALLVAVFPANIYMWTHHVQPDGAHIPGWFHAVRLPLQLVLIWWAWLYTRAPRSVAVRPVAPG